MKLKLRMGIFAVLFLMSLSSQARESMELVRLTQNEVHHYKIEFLDGVIRWQHRVSDTEFSEVIDFRILDTQAFEFDNNVFPLPSLIKSRITTSTLYQVMGTDETRRIYIRSNTQSGLQYLFEVQFSARHEQPTHIYLVGSTSQQANCSAALVSERPRLPNRFN